MTQLHSNEQLTTLFERNIMTAKNPLPVLVCYTETLNESLSVAIQKLCVEGKAKGQVSTHNIPLDPAGKPKISRAAGTRMTKDLQLRCIHHHGQPQIVEILDSALQDAGFVGLNNDIKCTLEILNDAVDCEYETGLFELAHRQGIPSSTCDFARSNSAELCAIYTKIFTSYIRHVKDDIFGTSTKAASDWSDRLTSQEKKSIPQIHPSKKLPEGWTIQEAQAFWLMHSSGIEISILASTVGHPETVLQQVLDLFQVS